MLPLRRVLQTDSCPFSQRTMHLPVAVSHASRPACWHAASSVHGTERRSHPAQLSRTRAPAIWICELHPRRAERRALKSKSSCTSAPESCIFAIELSNGKMLYICSTVIGPGLRSARIPVEFVIEKSVWIPSRGQMALPPTLPSGESPPVLEWRREPLGL